MIVVRALVRARCGVVGQSVFGTGTDLMDPPRTGSTYLLRGPFLCRRVIVYMLRIRYVDPP